MSSPGRSALRYLSFWPRILAGVALVAAGLIVLLDPNLG